MHIFRVKNWAGSCPRSESFLVFVLLLCLRSHLKAALFGWRRLCFSKVSSSFEDLAVFAKTARTWGSRGDEGNETDGLWHFWPSPLDLITASLAQVEACVVWFLTRQRYSLQRRLQNGESSFSCLEEQGLKPCKQLSVTVAWFSTLTFLVPLPAVCLLLRWRGTSSNFPGLFHLVHLVHTRAGTSIAYLRDPTGSLWVCSRYHNGTLSERRLWRQPDFPNRLGVVLPSNNLSRKARML